MSKHSIPTVTFIGLIIATILSLILYFTKSQRERDKETPVEIFLRSVLPSLFISILFTLCYFQSSLNGVQFRSFRTLLGTESPQEYLNENFSD